MRGCSTEIRQSCGRIDAQRRQYSALAAAAPPQQIASVLQPPARVRVYAEVSVDHSIELLDNGRRRRRNVRAQRLKTVVAWPNACAQQNCQSTDALAASSCPSPPLRAAPAASKTDRTTHQSQRPLGDVARRRARPLWDSPRRTRRGPKTRSATRRRRITAAFGGRRALPVVYLVALTAPDQKQSRLRRPQSPEAHY